VSVAALRPSVVVFREEQNFAWWVYAALAAMVGLVALALFWKGRDAAPPVEGWSLEVPLFLAVGLALPSVLVVGVLRMTTEVTPADCRVWFGWIPTYRHAVPLPMVQRVEVVLYRPIADCGGWGVRWGRGGERVFNARGNRGVRLYLTDGNRVLIGSQQPEELARAIEQARRTAA
jgi:hypothetical protein